MVLTENKRTSGIFFPIVLGLLTAFGPFVTDFYLPVLPEMSGFFSTSPALVSMSLTAGMLGLALGQLFIGPLTDKYGRRLILIFSMTIFVVSTIGCIFSQNIFTFNILRFFQGLGGAGGIVISKSMASDIYSGKELVRFMGILGAINGIAPVAAPMIGGAMSEVASWQGIFILLLILGAILGVCCVRLPETLSVDRRINRSLAGTYLNIFRVFRNSAYTVVIIFTMAGGFSFFGYISSSPFIIQNLYGLTPLGFSICFSVNALMIGVGAGLASFMRNRILALKISAVAQLAGTSAVAICLIFHLNIWLLMAAYILMLFSFGLWQPGAASLALDLERGNSGAASAVFGASLFIAGGVASPIVGLGDITLMSSIVIVSGALIALPMAFLAKEPS